MQGRPSLEQVTNIPQAIQNNYTDMFKLFQSTNLVELHQSNGLIRASSHIDSPIFNSVLQAHLTESASLKCIDDVITWSETESIAVLWATGPNTKPNNLSGQLKKNGFQLVESPAGMAIDLTNVSQEHGLTDDLIIKRVSNESLLEQWVNVVVQVFQLSEVTAKAFYDLYSQLGFSAESPFVNYIGINRDKVVSTASVFYDGTSAGIYNVATIETARHHDFGTKITHNCLVEAIKRGYLSGVLQGASDAVSIYKSLGFKKYCTFEQHLYTPTNK